VLHVAAVKLMLLTLLISVMLITLQHCAWSNKLYKPSCHVMECEGAGGWVGGGKGQTHTCESPSMHSGPSTLSSNAAMTVGQIKCHVCCSIFQLTVMTLSSL